MKSEIIADIFILVGLAVMAFGIWMFKPWLSLTALGAVVCGLGVLSFLVKR